MSFFNKIYAAVKGDGEVEDMETIEQKIPVLLKRAKTCENYEELMSFLEQILEYSEQDKLKMTFGLNGISVISNLLSSEVHSNENELILTLLEIFQNFITTKTPTSELIPVPQSPNNFGAQLLQKFRELIHICIFDEMKKFDDEIQSSLKTKMQEPCFNLLDKIFFSRMQKSKEQVPKIEGNINIISVIFGILNNQILSLRAAQENPDFSKDKRDLCFSVIYRCLQIINVFGSYKTYIIPFFLLNQNQEIFSNFLQFFEYLGKFKKRHPFSEEECSFVQKEAMNLLKAITLPNFEYFDDLHSAQHVSFEEEIKKIEEILTHKFGEYFQEKQEDKKDKYFQNEERYIFLRDIFQKIQKRNFLETHESQRKQILNQLVDKNTISITLSILNDFYNAISLDYSNDSPNTDYNALFEQKSTKFSELQHLQQQKNSSIFAVLVSSSFQIIFNFIFENLQNMKWLVFESKGIQFLKNFLRIVGITIPFQAKKENSKENSKERFVFDVTFSESEKLKGNLILQLFVFNVFMILKELFKVQEQNQDKSFILNLKNEMVEKEMFDYIIHFAFFHNLKESMMQADLKEVFFFSIPEDITHFALELIGLLTYDHQPAQQFFESFSFQKSRIIFNYQNQQIAEQVQTPVFVEKTKRKEETPKILTTLVPTIMPAVSQQPNGVATTPDKSKEGNVREKIMERTTSWFSTFKQVIGDQAKKVFQEEEEEREAKEREEKQKTEQKEEKQEISTPKKEEIEVSTPKREENIEKTEEKQEKGDETEEIQQKLTATFSTITNWLRSRRSEEVKSEFFYYNDSFSFYYTENQTELHQFALYKLIETILYCNSSIKRQYAIHALRLFLFNNPEGQIKLASTIKPLHSFANSSKDKNETNSLSNSNDLMKSIFLGNVITNSLLHILPDSQDFHPLEASFAASILFEIFSAENDMISKEKQNNNEEEMNKNKKCQFLLMKLPFEWEKTNSKIEKTSLILHFFFTKKKQLTKLTQNKDDLLQLSFFDVFFRSILVSLSKWISYSKKISKKQLEESQNQEYNNLDQQSKQKEELDYQFFTKNLFSVLKLAIFWIISLNREVKNAILLKQQFSFYLWKIFEEISEIWGISQTQKNVKIHQERKRFGIIKLFVVVALFNLAIADPKNQQEKQKEDLETAFGMTSFTLKLLILQKFNFNLEAFDNFCLKLIRTNIPNYLPPSQNSPLFSSASNSNPATTNVSELKILFEVQENSAENEDSNDGEVNKFFVLFLERNILAHLERAFSETSGIPADQRKVHLEKLFAYLGKETMEKYLFGNVNLNQKNEEYNKKIKDLESVLETIRKENSEKSKKIEEVSKKCDENAKLVVAKSDEISNLSKSFESEVSKKQLEFSLISENLKKKNEELETISSKKSEKIDEISKQNQNLNEILKDFNSKFENLSIKNEELTLLLEQQKKKAADSLQQQQQAQPPNLENLNVLNAKARQFEEEKSQQNLKIEELTNRMEEQSIEIVSWKEGAKKLSGRVKELQSLMLERDKTIEHLRMATMK